MKLGKRFKFFFLSICFAIFASGTVVWIFDKFVRVHGLIDDEHHPAEQIFLHAHGITAYFFLIAFGYLIRSHILPGLAGRHRKLSGISLLTLIGILTITAFPILYAMDGSFRTDSSTIHTYLGLSIPILFLFHLWKRKAIRQQLQ